VTHELLVLVLLSTGCAGAGDEDVPVAAQQENPQAQLVKIRQSAEQARWDLDALRCFLLHKEEVKAGRVPKGWKQPMLARYEQTEEHPCNLLPGFVDPKLEERLAIEKAKAKLVIKPIRSVPVQ
jgi:hypothetical protein